ALCGELVPDLARLDWVVERVPAPLVPAAVVDGNSWPTHQVCVEPGLARPPAGPAIEGDPLVGSDAGLFPVGCDLRVGTHRVVHVAVVLHVVGVRAAVAPDVACDPARRTDVVVAADLADVLVPGPDADEGGSVGIEQDLLRLLDVDDDLRAARNLDPERRDGRRLADNRLQWVARLDPPVIASVEEADVVDAAVAQDQRRACRRDLAGPTPRPLLVRIAFGIAAVENDGRVERDSERAESFFELLRRSAVPVIRVLEPIGVEVERPRDVALLVLLPYPEIHVEEQEGTDRRG